MAKSLFMEKASLPMAFSLIKSGNLCVGHIKATTISWGICTDYGHSNSLQPKSISQSQIENPVKCMKIFLKKKWLSNTKSGTRDTQWQNLRRYSATQNALKYLTTYSSIYRSKYLWYLKKRSSHWISIVRGNMEYRIESSSSGKTIHTSLQIYTFISHAWRHHSYIHIYVFPKGFSNQAETNKEKEGSYLYNMKEIGNSIS